MANLGRFRRWCHRDFKQSFYDRRTLTIESYVSSNYFGWIKSAYINCAEIDANTVRVNDAG